MQALAQETRKRANLGVYPVTRATPTGTFWSYKSRSTLEDAANHETFGC